jgi:acyl dehydratase
MNSPPSESTAAFLDELHAAVGTEIGKTDWFMVTQRDADLFSALTDDWDFMHNDPAWAQSRLGGTIAHGLYLLSLLPSFLKQVAPDSPIVASDEISVLNYGFDRVRFASHVHIGERARDCITIEDVTERKPGDFLTRYRHTLEKEDGTVCLVADSLFYYVTGYEVKWQTSSDRG